MDVSVHSYISMWRGDIEDSARFGRSVCSEGAASVAMERRLMERINYERMRHVPYDARRFNLDRMRWLLRRCGEPQCEYPIVHITGTKGKGSTAAMLEAIFRYAGWRTGLFTSPHLTTIRERFRINGTPIEEEKFVRVCTDILERVDAANLDEIPSQQTPTYFEILTAVGMCLFAQESVDIAILEVGLGGRFDATNVCDPILSIITSIDYDHCDQLGETLEKIAYEKAGILKSGVPAICGVTEPGPAAVIRHVATQVETPLFTVVQNSSENDIDFDNNNDNNNDRSNGTYCYTYTPAKNLEIRETYGKLNFRMKNVRIDEVEISLPGAHQAANAACAMAAIYVLKKRSFDAENNERIGRYNRRDFWARIQTISASEMRRALTNVHWPGRVEIVRRRPTIVFDAAHNPVSITALIRTLAESFESRRRILVFAATQEKKIKEMVEIIQRFRFDTILLTEHSNTARAVPLNELFELFNEVEKQNVKPTKSSRKIETFPSAKDAFQRAIHIAKTEDLICVTGSFYLISDLWYCIQSIV